jgi:hypothetical protein
LNVSIIQVPIKYLFIEMFRDVLKGGAMLRKILKFVILLVVILLFGCDILLGLTTTVLRGHMDFPCFNRFIEASHCMDLSYSHLEPNAAAQIEVFMNYHDAGYWGASCDYQASNGSTLEFNTVAGRLNLIRVGETLIVNGETLTPGMVYRRTNLFYFHPWAIGKVEIQNLGVMTTCDSDVEPRLVIIGRHGSELSVWKGIIVTLALLGILAWLIRSLRRPPGKQQASDVSEMT